MKARARMRRGGAGIVLAGVLGALAVASGTAAQERAPRPRREEPQECRCVDDAGNELERCFCMVMPDVDVSGAMALARRAVLGVNVRADQPERWDGQGVRVYGVDEDSPAGEAGLREDDVIVRVDGQSVLEPLGDARAEERLSEERSLPVQRLLHVLGEREPGDTVRIEYLRGSERRTASAVLGEPRRFFGFGRPGTAAVPVPPIPPVAMRAFRMDWNGRECPSAEGSASARRPRVVVDFGRSCVAGVELIEMREGLARYFGAGEGAVLVADAREDNPLGLRAGDVVLAVDGREVEGVEAALRALRSYEQDEEIRLRVLRRQETLELTGRVR